MKRSIFLLVALITFSIAASDAHAACTDIDGTFETTDVPCLSSPLLLCIDGEFSGDLQASYGASFQSLAPAPTLAQPLRLAYSSSDQYVTSSETLTGDTSGYIVLNDTVAALVCVIGCAADAQCLGECLLDHASTSFTSSTILDDDRGSFSAAGTGSYSDGTSVGTYTGQICEP